MCQACDEADAAIAGAKAELTQHVERLREAKSSEHALILSCQWSVQRLVRFYANSEHGKPIIDKAIADSLPILGEFTDIDGNLETLRMVMTIGIAMDRVLTVVDEVMRKLSPEDVERLAGLPLDERRVELERMGMLPTDAPEGKREYEH